MIEIDLRAPVPLTTVLQSVRDGRHAVGLAPVPPPGPELLGGTPCVPFEIRDGAIRVYATPVAATLHDVRAFVAVDHAVRVTRTVCATAHQDIVGLVRMDGWQDVIDGGNEAGVLALCVPAIALGIGCALWPPWWEAFRARPEAPPLPGIDEYWRANP